MDNWKKKIVLLMAECNMNIAETARRAYTHRNNVEYHLGKIKRETGLDPKNFYDLVKLLETINTPG